MKSGDRVRLFAPSPLVRLASDTGEIIRPDDKYPDLGFWIVRLDHPAQELDLDATGRVVRTTLIEIVEHEDNMEVLECRSR